MIKGKERVCAWCGSLVLQLREHRVDCGLGGQGEREHGERKRGMRRETDTERPFYSIQTHY
jgi:hypothetical protein